jgi:hypothetical protein
MMSTVVNTPIYNNYYWLIYDDFIGCSWLLYECCLMNLPSHQRITEGRARCSGARQPDAVATACGGQVVKRTSVGNGR